MYLLSLSLKDMIIIEVYRIRTLASFFDCLPLNVVSSPTADELSPTHSASSMLLPLSLSLPSFNHHYFPSGLWATDKSSTCFLCSLSYLILNWLNKPIYSDCWLIFLKHTSDYVLGYLQSFKDSTSHSKPGYGRRKLQAWRIRWGLTGESRGHWEFAARGPWKTPYLSEPAGK